MTKAEEIFNAKAEYNKWLKELTNDEKELVLEMINEALHQSNVVGRSEQLCRTFLSDGTKTSATKCRFCGKEKWEH